MTKNRIRFILFLIVTIVLFICLGCSSSGPTKQNEPFAGPYPEEFNKLALLNPVVAKEIGKLPELQDGISDSEVNALERLYVLYSKHPDSFDVAFNQMYQVGKPEVRKFCSPLQALFWLAEDNNLRDEYIVEYSLPKLLSAAWKRKETIFTKDQAVTIIEGIKNKQTQNQFFQYVQNGVDEATVNTIMAKYKNNPYMFTWSARKIIKKALIPDSRWSDIDSVIDRFNAPELFDFYINHHIAYATKIPAYHRSPRSVMNERYGDCDDLAYFGKIALTKAGYDTFGRMLGSCNRKGDCHIGLGIKLEDGMYFLAVNFGSGGDNRMGGPYNNLDGFDHALSRGIRYQTKSPFYFDW